MKPTIRWLTLGLALLLALAACAPAPGSTVAPTATALPTASPTPRQESQEAERMPTATALKPLPPGADELVVLAVEDLAGRLDVAADQVEVLDAEAVEWSDSSLGCPQPGMMYAQVITPGYRIVLAAGESAYEYHTDRGQRVVLCEHGGTTRAEEEDVKSSPIAPTPQDPGLQRMVALVVEDLAARLGVEAERIDLLEVSAVTWPDKSLGCPQPGMAYAQVPVDGVLIRLEVEGQVYEYNGGGGREPFLCEQKLQAPKSPPKPPDQIIVPPPGSSDD
jgi:hypothetical protein